MKVVAYILAGSVLILIAEFAPKFALGTAGLIGLWAVLDHSNQLTVLGNFINTNTKG